MRLSENETTDGKVLNGFDYQFQVWVFNGIVQGCGHPEAMGPTCCNGRKYKGMKIEEIKYCHAEGATK